VASVAALLLIAGTFGPFSFVEAAIVLTALGVLALVKQRADRKRFHLPFGDGTVIMAAGLWTGVLIVVRLFDRDLGQSILSLACAAILAGAGARERAKRPADDVAPLPPPGPRDRGRAPRARPVPPRPDEEATTRLEDDAPPPRAEDPTERLAIRDAPTEERPAASRPPRGRDDDDGPPRPGGRP